MFKRRSSPRDVSPFMTKQSGNYRVIQGCEHERVPRLAE